MKVFYLTIVLLTTLDLFSQELYFNNIDLKQLPSSEAYQVFQDSKGVIWIATDAGLCKYNGNEAITYTTKDGLCDNVILEIYEDDKNRVWFSTLSGGIFYFENGRFNNIAANKDLIKMVNYNYIGSFTLGENDTLYITAAAKDGLIKIPPEHNYKKIIKELNTFKNVNRYVLPNKTTSKEIIVGCGMNSLNLTDSVYTIYCSDTILTVSFKKIHNYYFSCTLFRSKSTQNGDLYIPTSNQIAVIKKNTNNIEYHHFAFDILKIIEDRDGDIWICTKNGGGYLYKNANLNSRAIQFLYPLSITSIFMDREGSIWASTLEKGVFKCINKNILYFNENNDKPVDLKKTEKKIIIPYRSKKEIIIYNNDSVYINTKAKKYLPSISYLSSIAHNKLNYYYATTIGLFHLDKKDKITDVFKNNKAYLIKDVFEIEKDTFLAFSTNNINIIYKKSIISQIRSNFPINCISQLKNKTILIGSRNNDGIYNYKNNLLIPYLSNIPQFKTRINCIGEDNMGNLWIGTNEKGIYCYDNSNKLHIFNENRGLISNKINTFCFDKKGNLWYGTNKGLGKIVILENRTPTILNFNTDHGIVDFEIEKVLEFNNKIWCASKENLFYFESNKLIKNKIPPLINIKSVSINNNNYYNLKDTPKFNYDENNIRFQSILISYKNLEKREFIYKLNGYDKEWQLSTTGDIQYTNLNSGAYTYTTYGLNNDNVKSLAPATFSFIIKKPFWLTWWFISFVFLCLIICIFIIIKLFKNKIEKKETEKTNINQKIAQLQMTAIRAQMNPHFLFNAICSIQNYIIKNDSIQSYHYLSKFSLLIRNILDNSKEDYLDIEQEIKTLKLYIELEQVRFKHPFEAIIDIDKELNMDFEIPTMLIQPYIENAIWHGLMPKKTKGILWLVLKKENNSLKISIKDNGVGRPLESTFSNKAHESKGMLLTKERLEAMKIKYKKNFNLKIIDLKDSQGSAVGTEVTITIPIDLN